MADPGLLKAHEKAQSNCSTRKGFMDPMAVEGAGSDVPLSWIIDPVLAVGIIPEKDRGFIE